MNKIRQFLAAALLGTVIAVVFAGCASLTPTQQIALANAEAGNAYATYKLNQNPASLPGLQHLAAALPLIPQGKVSANELGQLDSELHATQAAAAPGSKFAGQVGSLISLVAQANAGASQGNLTAEQALVLAACQDAANGILNAIAFYQGQHGIKPSS